MGLFPFDNSKVLDFPKNNGPITPPVGTDPTALEPAQSWNDICQAVYDFRASIQGSAIYYGLTPQASQPAGNAVTHLFVKTNSPVSQLFYHDGVSNTNNLLLYGNTGPGAGTYGGGGSVVQSITLDDQGRVTALTTGAGGGVTGSGATGQIVTWASPTSVAGATGLNFTNSPATDTMTIGSGTTGLLYVNNNQLGAPTFTTLSPGTRFIFQTNGLDGSHAPYAFGIESGHIWFGLDVSGDDAGHGYKWYAGTTLLARLSGTGTLNVAVGLQVNGTSVVLTTRALTAGTGLAGGGDLSADRTFSVDQSFSPTWTGTHTFSNVITVRTRVIDPNFTNPTDGQVLAWSAANSAYIPQSVSGTGAVTGTGTTGTFAVWSGTSTLTDSSNITESGATVTLGAGSTLSATAGSGALSFGSMTGATAMPTGNFSWTGASTKTLSLAASGAASVTSATALTLTGGAASTWSTSSGALTLTSAAAATWKTAAGALTVDSAAALNLGTSVATGVVIGASGIVTTISSTTLNVATRDIKPNFTNPTDGQALTWSTTNSAYIPQTVSGGVTGTGTTGTFAVWSGTSAIGNSSNLTESGAVVTLAAGASLSGAAGAGALSLGSMTGATALPTGNLSWSGASTKTFSLAATGAGGTGSITTGSGALTFTAGAASTWSTSSGALTLTSAAAATWATAAGALTLNGTSGVNLQAGAATLIDVGVTTGTTVTLAANVALAGAAGTGALSFGSMTGAAAMPTGNFSWAGASTKTFSFAATGAGGTGSITTGSAALTITGGAASTWSTSSGALTLTSAAAATWKTSAGALTVDSAAALNLGTSTATSLSLGASGITTTVVSNTLNVATRDIKPNFTNPTDGQALTWSTANSAYIPQTVSGSGSTGTTNQLAYFSGTTTITSPTASWTTDANFNLALAPVASSTGSPTAFKVTGPNSSTITRADLNDILFDNSSIVNFAAGGGTVANVRSTYVKARTYTATTNALTLTNAATFTVSGAAIASTNVTISNPISILSEGGAVVFAGAKGLAIGTAFPQQHSTPGYVYLDIRGDTTAHSGLVLAANSDLSSFTGYSGGDSGNRPAIIFKNSKTLDIASASDPVGASYAALASFSGTTTPLMTMVGTTPTINMAGTSTGAGLIKFNGVGFAAPTFSTYSAGTKIVLFDDIGASSAGYAIGIEADVMWFGVEQNANTSPQYGFKWYWGTTALMSATTDGTIVTMALTGALTTTKTVSIGTHLIATGSAPTATIGTATQLGTSPSAALTQGTDIAGVVTVTTGTAPAVFVGGTAITAVTVNFNVAFASAPRGINITPANSAAAAAMSGATGVQFFLDYASTTTAHFVIMAVDSGAGSLTGSTAYAFNYSVVQ